ncbi:MAG TPA: hypothetical protein VMZ04_02640, partial [Anaerolineae bacterium]|nr:hypothetical protein [Anaerolineae bacterium]
MKQVQFIFSVILLSVRVAGAGTIIIATSDYVSSSNTAVYSVDSTSVYADILGYNDQDVQLKTDGYYIYVLERGMGAITKYSLAGLKAGHKIWQYSV